MGNSNSSNQASASKSPTTPSRPPHPPRKKSLELPDIQAALALSPVAPTPSQPIQIHTPRERSSSLEVPRRSPSHRRSTPLPIRVPQQTPHRAALLDLDHTSPIPIRHAQGSGRAHRVSSSAYYEHDSVSPNTSSPPQPGGSSHSPAISRSAPSKRPDPIGPVEGYILSSIPLGIEPEASATEDLSTDKPSQTPAPANCSDDSNVPITLAWKGSANNVFVAGTFDNAWNGRTRLVADPNSPSTFSVSIRLPPGNHRLKFIVDDQWRCSDDLPTATDSDGNLVNYIEIPFPLSPSHSTSWDPAVGGFVNRQPKPWTSVIPPHLVRLAAMEEQYLTSQAGQNQPHGYHSQTPSPQPPPIPNPPVLPRHLEKVILNLHSRERERTAMEGMGDDNSVLPVPNHVVLNHLSTSAIKNGVLAVASTTRYHRKYVSTIYYKPVTT